MHSFNLSRDRKESKIILKCDYKFLTVTEYNTVRMTTYNFLLWFHSNYVPIL